MTIKEKVTLEAIIPRWVAGETTTEIASDYGVCRQYIHMVLKAAGYDRHTGGQHVKAKAKIENSNKKLYRKDYGCSFRELMTYSKYIRHAYKRQRDSAKIRKIEWFLTIKDWTEIWESSGKFHLRGRGTGYVMARFNDIGPYAKDNVKIITQAENTSECLKKMWAKAKASPS